MQSLKVVDYMNQHPVEFDVNMSVAQAVELLLAKQQTGGPVVNHNRCVVVYLRTRRMEDVGVFYREQVARVRTSCEQMC